MGDIGVYGMEAWRIVFLLLLFEIHVTRRLYECVFVSSFDASARMNFFGYLIALGYSSSPNTNLYMCICLSQRNATRLLNAQCSEYF